MGESPTSILSTCRRNVPLKNLWTSGNQAARAATAGRRLSASPGFPISSKLTNGFGNVNQRALLATALAGPFATAPSGYNAWFR